MLQDPAACHNSVGGCSLRTVFFAKGSIVFKSNFFMDVYLCVQGENWFLGLPWAMYKVLYPSGLTDFTQGKGESMEYHQHKSGE